MMAASSKRWCKVLELAGEILMNEKNASHATIIADPQFMRPLGLADEAAVAELFEACFSSKTDSQWYAWKYLSNKTYDGLAIGMWHEAGLIGHYAGFPRELVCGSTRFAALQIGDVMIHPKARHGLAKANRFAKLTRAYLATHLRAAAPQRLRPFADAPRADEVLKADEVHRADEVHKADEVRRAKDHQAALKLLPQQPVDSPRFDIAYGFPNARHMRQCVLQACYRAADAMFELCWSLDRFNPTYDGDASPIGISSLSGATEWALGDWDSDRFDAIAKQMLEALADKGHWAVPRSLAYWRWRFPLERGYRWVLMREGATGPLVAAAVLKRMSDDGLACELLDWLCAPIMKTQAFAALLWQLRSEKLGYLRSWCSEASASYFVDCPADRIEKLGFHIALSVYPEAHTADCLGGGLWMLSGDTDFR